ncbi:hypothetical protein H696_00437 [Fonticula alba]|uniref:protein-tyrosine-phosphatase n=1 Tax=Fonticula alba TaxID=691883 RepID=A0A058ZER7_FONAL|nr:hypothetical protein H696_00437 [Fonticula alba]KCV72864.1 hypothetical protein H696_00437 [Fonticula alba]|eukprot:XP_009492565.1 hypothetical protein H696_00437 [Fonticula alba]
MSATPPAANAAAAPSAEPDHLSPSALKNMLAQGVPQRSNSLIDRRRNKVPSLKIAILSTGAGVAASNPGSSCSSPLSLEAPGLGGARGGDSNDLRPLPSPLGGGRSSSAPLHGPASKLSISTVLDEPSSAPPADARPPALNLPQPSIRQSQTVGGGGGGGGGAHAAGDDSIPSMVLPFLYLGGEHHARDAARLSTLGISALLNVAIECDVPPGAAAKMSPPLHGSIDPKQQIIPNSAPSSPELLNTINSSSSSSSSVTGSPDAGTSIAPAESITPPLPPVITSYCHLPIRDNLEEDIMQYFEPAFKYIDACRERSEKVLVHCAAGRSRSPTVVMAYLIAREGWTLAKAYEHVQNQRPFVCPNLGFMFILAECERVSKQRRASERTACDSPSCPLLGPMIVLPGDVPSEQCSCLASPRLASPFLSSAAIAAATAAADARTPLPLDGEYTVPILPHSLNTGGAGAEGNSGADASSIAAAIAATGTGPATGPGHRGSSSGTSTPPSIAEPLRHHPHPHQHQHQHQHPSGLTAAGPGGGPTSLAPFSSSTSSVSTQATEQILLGLNRASISSHPPRVLVLGGSDDGAAGDDADPGPASSSALAAAAPPPASRLADGTHAALAPSSAAPATTESTGGGGVFHAPISLDTLKQVPPFDTPSTTSSSSC